MSQVLLDHNTTTAVKIFAVDSHQFPRRLESMDGQKLANRAARRQLTKQSNENEILLYYIETKVKLEMDLVNKYNKERIIN